jgi:hypothetical protein
MKKLFAIILLLATPNLLGMNGIPPEVDEPQSIQDFARFGARISCMYSVEDGLVDLALFNTPIKGPTLLALSRFIAQTQDTAATMFLPDGRLMIGLAKENAISKKSTQPKANTPQ